MRDYRDDADRAWEAGRTPSARKSDGGGFWSKLLGKADRMSTSMTHAQKRRDRRKEMGS